MRGALLGRRLVFLLLAVGPAAGVAVAQPQVPEWRVTAKPLLSLQDDGTPAHEFDRLAGAWRLPDGRVVVANGATDELRVFDANGALVETFGRKGKGPGEFVYMQVIGVAGDTVVVYDLGTRRATTVRFGQKAAVVSIVRMVASGVGSGLEVTGQLRDGRWVITMGLNSPAGWDAPKGVSRVKGTVGLIPADGGGTVERVADVRGLASITYMPSANKATWRTGPAAFSPWFRGVVSGDAFWFGESSSDTLARLDSRGDRRQVALPLPAVPPPASLVAAAKEAEVRVSRKFGEGTEYPDFKYGSANLPEHLPYYNLLLAGPDGELWVQEYATEQDAAGRYLVLDAEGRAIGHLSVPPRFRVTYAGRDVVVGITRDADDVEGVAVLRLERR